MPFNERITNHRRLMRAAMFRLSLIEEQERTMKDKPDLQLDWKITLIREYGAIMDELANTIYHDAGMPKYQKPNMVELAENYYKNKVGRIHKGAVVGCRS